MFTGIIVEVGRFAGFRNGRREAGVEAPGLAEKAGLGASVAIDGVCLTVVRREGPTLYFDLSQETLSRTTLEGLRPGAPLNLELPVTPSSLLGGHLVSGHVDFKGKVLRVAARRPGKRLTVSFPRDYGPFFIDKGSVAVNGVSLTIAALSASSFEVELIPATLGGTNLGGLRAGDPVNVECDLIGKYVYNAVLKAKR